MLTALRAAYTRLVNSVNRQAEAHEGAATQIETFFGLTGPSTSTPLLEAAGVNESSRTDAGDGVSPKSSRRR